LLPLRNDIQPRAGKAEGAEETLTAPGQDCKIEQTKKEHGQKR
jgi:hypothetical protein